MLKCFPVWVWKRFRRYSGDKLAFAIVLDNAPDKTSSREAAPQLSLVAIARSFNLQPPVLQESIKCAPLSFEFTL